MMKEKQIEEIAKDIFHAGVALDGVDFAYGLFDDDDHFRRLARKLHESGYRKADEVRKETVREILNLVYQRVKDISGKSEYLLDDESIYEDSSLFRRAK